MSEESSQDGKDLLNFLYHRHHHYFQATIFLAPVVFQVHLPYPVTSMLCQPSLS